jgi:flagellar hook-associated protein 1 FlgK
MSVFFPTNLLGMFDIGRRALSAQQTVITTVGHNLANQATPGYSRERADLSPVGPTQGVEVTAIQRIRDRFLDSSLVTEQQDLGRLQAQDGLLQRLQAIVTDAPGTGVSAVLDQFFQGLQDLSVRPSDQALRVTVKDAGERVAATFQGARTRLDQLKTDIGTEIRDDVSKANGLLGQIGELNRQIIAANNGPTPNDLLDRRDQLVTQLAQVVGVTVKDNPNGSVRIDLAGSGVYLVDGTSTVPLATTYNGANDTLDLTVGTTAVTPRSGALAAVLSARNSPTGVLKQAVTDLNTLAQSVIAEVNGIHASGAGLSEFTTLTAATAVGSSSTPLSAAGLAFPPGGGSFQVIVHDATGAVLSTVTVPVAAGTTTLGDVKAAIDADPNLAATVSGGKLQITATAGNTFTFASDTSGTLAGLGLNTFFTGASALDIGVNPVIEGDVTKIAAAQADTGGLVHPGDGSNALALARLRTAPTMSGGTDTFTGFYGTLVSRIGSQTRDNSQALDQQQAAVQLVQGLQQQTSGVSTDEELITLTQSQHAYAAAARFVTTVDELIQTLLAMAPPAG